MAGGSPGIHARTVRRNAGIALCRRESVFFYALCEGTEFDFPEFAADMSGVRRVAEHSLATGVGRHAEVAYVISEKMFKAAPLPDEKLRRSAEEGCHGWRSASCCVSC